MKETIHPAGDVIHGMELVYEPIGSSNYLWNYKGQRGISKARPIYKTEMDNKGKRKNTKKISHWEIDIGESSFKFTGVPINKPLFRTPPMSFIHKWVDHKYKVKSAGECVSNLKTYYKICLDLPLEYCYDILVLTTLQMWLVNVLNVVFHGRVIGAFGTGKTVVLECLETVGYHACQSGSISASSIAYLTDRQKLNLLHDELDVKTNNSNSEDNMKNMIIRQCYRRGSKYVRTDARSLEPIVTEPFAVHVYSVHSSVERAMTTRGLPINMGETDDSRLSIINVNKGTIGRRIHTDLFFWYMTNILTKDITQLTQITQFTDITIQSNKNINEIREEIYQNAISNFPKEYVNFLKKYKGRNTELGYIALLVSKTFGINMLNSLEESFEEKLREEEEAQPNVYVNILKDLLIDHYEMCRDSRQPAQINKDGFVWETNKAVHESHIDKIKLIGQIPAGKKKFGEYLRSFGFVQGVNRKNMLVPPEHLFQDEKARYENGKKKMVLIFDKKVLKKLGMLDNGGNVGNQRNMGNKLEIEETVVE